MWENKRTKLPPAGRCVLLRVMSLDKDETETGAVVVGYCVTSTAKVGKKTVQQVQWITPGIKTGIVLWWNDCLGDYFKPPKWNNTQSQHEEDRHVWVKKQYAVGTPYERIVQECKICEEDWPQFREKEPVGKCLKCPCAQAEKENGGYIGEKNQQSCFSCRLNGSHCSSCDKCKGKHYVDD